MGEIGEKGVDGVRRVIAWVRSVRICVPASSNSSSDGDCFNGGASVFVLGGFDGLLVRMASPYMRLRAWARLFLALA